MFQSPAFKIFDFLFGIPLIHDIMFGVYRKQIVEKAGDNICHSQGFLLLCYVIHFSLFIVLSSLAGQYSLYYLMRY